MLISKLVTQYLTSLPNKSRGIKIIQPLFFLTPQHKYNFCSQKQQKPTINPEGQYYQKLEIKSQAKLIQIKKSYYLLSRKYHPDVNKSKQSVQKFNTIRQAYQILSNIQLRTEYDKILKQKQKRQSSNTQDTKKQQQQQQQYSSNKSGPYQNSSNNNKSYYNLTKAQWNQTRRGINQQSFTSVHSAHARSIGVNADDDIGHFQRKTLFFRNNQLREKREIMDKEMKDKEIDEIKVKMKREQQRVEKLRKIMEKRKADKQRHMERVKMIKQENKGIGLFESIKSIFSRGKNESK